MITVKHENIKIKLPTVAHEITVFEYFDFLEKKNDYLKLLHNENSEMQEVMLAIVKSINCIVKIGVEKLLNIPANSKKDLEAGALDNFMFDIDNQDVTLFRLLSHITNIIDSYKGKKTDRFCIEGTWYYLTNSAKCLFGMKDTHDLTVNDVMTIAEFERRTNNVIQHRDTKIYENTKKDKDGKEIEEPISVLMSDRLRKLAVLYRKKDENLPLGIAERETFLHSRMYLFSNAPMTIALDAAFFLKSSLVALVKETTQQSILADCLR